ncbi:MAG: hypothetical protein J0I32_09725 [Sphingobacteriales bacterium]|nr:hypothetical protein [Sphingobacteriales bacterium]
MLKQLFMKKYALGSIAVATAIALNSFMVSPRPTAPNIPKYWYTTNSAGTQLTGRVDAANAAIEKNVASSRTTCPEEVLNFECARAFDNPYNGGFPATPPSGGVDHLYTDEQ